MAQSPANEDGRMLWFVYGNSLSGMRGRSALVPAINAYWPATLNAKMFLHDQGYPVIILSSLPRDRVHGEVLDINLTDRVFDSMKYNIHRGYRLQSVELASGKTAYAMLWRAPVLGMDEISTGDWKVYCEVHNKRANFAWNPPPLGRMGPRRATKKAEAEKPKVEDIPEPDDYCLRCMGALYLDPTSEHYLHDGIWIAKTQQWIEGAQLDGHHYPIPSNQERTVRGPQPATTFVAYTNTELQVADR